MPYLLLLLYRSFELSFTLFLFPNNNRYSQWAKYAPQTKRYSYGKNMTSDSDPNLT